jgi:hypothetical protein
MNIFAGIFKFFFSIISALSPKIKQLYAERSAGKFPHLVPTDIAEKMLDETLNRLGNASENQPWWQHVQTVLGAAAIQSDLFKKPHMQEWLSQEDVRRLLKLAARTILSGAEVKNSDNVALVKSYIGCSGENRQYAESAISTTLAVLKASILNKVHDPGAAAIGQAAGKVQLELLKTVHEKLNILGPRDLYKLTELARSYANLIPDDVGGTHLDRTAILEALAAKLSTARLVQIRGLPGSGKSAVVKRAVLRALERGPVIFLKAEQLEGTSWTSYATSQGLSGALLEHLLGEVGAVGTPIFYIDAIDRVEKEHQAIIIEIIRTIVKSPHLSSWRVVASLRDTGIELLHNWLGEFLDAMKVESLNVEQLNDEEARMLANAKPYLKPLLFGTSQVRDIVRRPFFAKVLHQSYTANPNSPAFAPQSEVDLIENWWRRGGYNESGQHAIERQRILLHLARTRARQLSKPINLSQLPSVAHIDDLKSDGILQDTREGISVRFAHDIFFEWAFFHVLADQGSQWMLEVKACGEPPAIARVVELVSQWEYTKGKDWPAYFTQHGRSDYRPQWLRAWLIGPLGTATFEVNEEQFTKAVFADNFDLFRKVLVWFQATKTSPNPEILSRPFPQEQRQRFAYLLGWPAEFPAWRRLIDFILRHISDIPQRLYPEVVAIFEVWQNALTGLKNPTSHALLKQCAAWLAAVDAINITHTSSENSVYWNNVPELGAFRKSLRRLLLRASKSEPIFADDYLHRVTDSERIRDDVFHDINEFSPILAQTLPQSLVKLALAFLQKELPDDKAARLKQERLREAEWREALLAKPEAERTPQESILLSHRGGLLISSDFSSFEWESLSINDDQRSFWPPSPLREPFHSLFQSSPNDALRLLHLLCNHAITAWRQLHQHSHDRRGTPISLQLTFPWGTQQFWGTDKEYLWFRGMWAPKVIGCGFMALEEWAFAELARSRPVEELIQQIIDGNECIAILGTVSMLALATETVSETTLPLFTSQRLFAADHNRMVHDLSSTANLIGFTQKNDQSHIDAIRTANARPVRKMQLCWMVPKFVFGAKPLRDKVSDAILNFKEELSYQYEEDRGRPEIREYLTNQALKYAELADPSNYQIYPTKEDSDQIAIVHVSPSATTPEHVAKQEEASKYLRLNSLWIWADKAFEKKTLHTTYTVKEAITLAQKEDSDDLFKSSNDESEKHLLSMQRGAVAAAAAVALNFREGSTEEDIKWARGVLGRAICLPEKPGPMWSTSSIIPWHQAIYVARGLAADLRHDTATISVARELLVLIAHPLEVVSITALEEVCKLWPKDSKLTWAGLFLAFSLCHVHPKHRNQTQQHLEILHPEDEIRTAVDAALAFYENGTGWVSLPLPPPAWVKVESGKKQHKLHTYKEYSIDDATDPTEEWAEPSITWNSQQAANIIPRIPFDACLNSSARNALLDFLADVLDWINQKNVPPWIKHGRRARSAHQHVELTHALGASLGRLAGLLPLRDMQSRFLCPILELESDNCWVLLNEFTETYICIYLYDAPVVPVDAVATLGLCLERLLKDSAFQRGSHVSGEFSGFYLPQLIRTLMFVSVEHAPLATRYVNGDWSEIDLILPLVDRFVRESGWTFSVMNAYLTFCERARNNYPAEAFADQVLSIIGDSPEELTGWHGTFIPARIAEIVQHFAHRDAPMTLDIAQKLLRILDMLVDLGDRRSAALQLDEAFREIRSSH